MTKNQIKDNKNFINLITGRNSYTDYNNNANSLKDKMNSNNNNNIMISIFDQSLNENKYLSNVDSNNPLGLSYQTQAYTQPHFYSSNKLNSTNSTDFSHKKIKNVKLILSKLRRTFSNIKYKRQNINKNFNSINQLKNEYNYSKSQKHFHIFSKTISSKFNLNNNKIKFNEDIKNKNKFKELRFKVHNTIRSNKHPICNDFINKAHLFNEKILEFYQSENYINLIRNFQNNFHYNINIENHPKINMFTDLQTLKKLSKTHKLDFKRCFSEKDQKLILHDPAYYFQSDSPNNFINVNIIKTKKLVDRIKEEDEEKQMKQILNNYLNKKNKIKNRNLKIEFENIDNKNDSKQRRLITKINRILSHNNIKNLTLKKLKKIDFTNISPSKNNKNELNSINNNEKYDFLKEYQENVKNSYNNADIINKIENEKKNIKEKLKFNLNKNLRNCFIEINGISKDKVLMQRAKENLYYDKLKEENNRFNITTKQALIEQNYAYLSKFGRKQIIKNKNNEKKEKDLSDNKEKKLLNLHINKIKLIYKKK